MKRITLLTTLCVLTVLPAGQALLVTDPPTVEHHCVESGEGLAWWVFELNGQADPPRVGPVEVAYRVTWEYTVWTEAYEENGKWYCSDNVVLNSCDISVLDGGSTFSRTLEGDFTGTYKVVPAQNGSASCDGEGASISNCYTLLGYLTGSTVSANEVPDSSL